MRRLARRSFGAFHCFVPSHARRVRQRFSYIIISDDDMVPMGCQLRVTKPPVECRMRLLVIWKQAAAAQRAQVDHARLRTSRQRASLAARIDNRTEVGLEILNRLAGR